MAFSKVSLTFALLMTKKIREKPIWETVREVDEGADGWKNEEDTHTQHWKIWKCPIILWVLYKSTYKHRYTNNSLYIFKEYFIFDVQVKALQHTMLTLNGKYYGIIYLVAHLLRYSCIVYFMQCFLFCFQHTLIHFNSPKNIGIYICKRSCHCHRHRKPCAF